MKLARALAAFLPGIGPLAAAGIGASAGLLSQPEPEIPTAMDDWDREFEARAGFLPNFSRLALTLEGAAEKARILELRREVNRQYAAKWSGAIGVLLPHSSRHPPTNDALDFAGKR